MVGRSKSGQAYARGIEELLPEGLGFVRRASCLSRVCQDVVQLFHVDGAPHGLGSMLYVGTMWEKALECLFELPMPADPCRLRPFLYRGLDHALGEPRHLWAPQPVALSDEWRGALSITLSQQALPFMELTASRASILESLRAGTCPLVAGVTRPALHALLATELGYFEEAIAQEELALKYAAGQPFEERSGKAVKRIRALRSSMGRAQVR